mmetsp:Transcript_3074/g.7071  ORF Transcript_3074/g.7071 Transcript_3074/m.7071 type:complete len:212 (+) Transcript_3074:699-1334(+)
MQCPAVMANCGVISSTVHRMDRPPMRWARPVHLNLPTAGCPPMMRRWLSVLMSTGESRFDDEGEVGGEETVPHAGSARLIPPNLHILSSSSAFCSSATPPTASQPCTRFFPLPPRDTSSPLKTHPLLAFLILSLASSSLSPALCHVCPLLPSAEAAASEPPSSASYARVGIATQTNTSNNTRTKAIPSPTRKGMPPKVCLSIQSKARTAVW